MKLKVSARRRRRRIERAAYVTYYRHIERLSRAATWMTMLIPGDPSRSEFALFDDREEAVAVGNALYGRGKFVAWTISTPAVVADELSELRRHGFEPRTMTLAKVTEFEKHRRREVDARWREIFKKEGIRP
jgi:hypothetical protein